MDNSKKINELIGSLEKLTGKKIIVEYADGQTISKSSQAATVRILVRGFDDWTKEQYAVAFYIIKFGKNKLPQPYNSMTLDQISADAGVKPSSLAMCLSRIKYMIKGEVLETGGPKIETYIKEFSNMDQQKLGNLAVSGLTTTSKPGQDISGHKFADTAVSKPVITRNDVSPEQLQNLNAKRLEKGEKPFKLRGGKLVSESNNTQKIVKEAINRLEQLTKNKVNLIGKGKEIKEAELNEFFASGSYNKLLRMLDRAIKQANTLYGLSAMYPDDWKGDETDKIKNALTSVFKTLTTGGKHLQQKQTQPQIAESVEKLNEWFAMGAYKKLLRMVMACQQQAEKVNNYLDKNPGKFQVDSKLVLAKIKKIWKTYNLSAAAGDNVGYAADDVNKMSHKAPKQKNVPQQNTQQNSAPTPQATNATSQAPKEKVPFSKRIANGIGKMFGEGEEIEEKEELQELFGFSKDEKTSC